MAQSANRAAYFGINCDYYRPLGVISYKLFGSAAGFHFGIYLAILQAVHVANSKPMYVFDVLFGSSLLLRCCYIGKAISS